MQGVWIENRSRRLSRETIQHVFMLEKADDFSAVHGPPQSALDVNAPLILHRAEQRIVKQSQLLESPLYLLRLNINSLIPLEFIIMLFSRTLENLLYTKSWSYVYWHLKIVSHSDKFTRPTVIFFYYCYYNYYYLNDELNEFKKQDLWKILN